MLSMLPLNRQKSGAFVEAVAGAGAAVSPLQLKGER